MKTIKDIETIIQKHKKELEEKYGLKEIGIFGSYVRGEQLQNSDIQLKIIWSPVFIGSIFQEIMNNVILQNFKWYDGQKIPLFKSFISSDFHFFLTFS